jgi:hypothetical protein
MITKFILAVPIIVMSAVCFALAAAAEQKSIECKDAGHYIGGIDRVYKLYISGPKDRKWDYTFEMLPASEGKITAGGTYELVDDLAIFTGKSNKSDIRFGINYGFPGGKVEFNGFFAAGDQELRYHRRWFRKGGDQWKPAEEITLSMPRALPKGNPWQVLFKGEHVVWDAMGKEKRETIEKTVGYKQLDGAGAYHLQQPLPNRTPSLLFPVAAGDRLQAVLFIPERGHGPGGVLRGFHPELADPNSGR